MIRREGEGHLSDVGGLAVQAVRHHGHHVVEHLTHAHTTHAGQPTGDDEKALYACSRCVLTSATNMTGMAEITWLQS
jgi:hypothetical protein